MKTIYIHLILDLKLNVQEHCFAGNSEAITCKDCRVKAKSCTVHRRIHAVNVGEWETKYSIYETKSIVVLSTQSEHLFVLISFFLCICREFMFLEKISYLPKHTRLPFCQNWKLRYHVSTRVAHLYSAALNTKTSILNAKL